MDEPSGEDYRRQRDELRRLIEPVLDDPWVVGGPYWDAWESCRFCDGDRNDRAKNGGHAKKCPVLRKDDLLGRRYLDRSMMIPLDPDEKRVLDALYASGTPWSGVIEIP